MGSQRVGYDWTTNTHTYTRYKSSKWLWITHCSKQNKKIEFVYKSHIAHNLKLKTNILLPGIYMITLFLKVNLINVDSRNPKFFYNLYEGIHKLRHINFLAL